jgi:hypothetical protein
MIRIAVYAYWHSYFYKEWHLNSKLLVTATISNVLHSRHPSNTSLIVEYLLHKWWSPNLCICMHAASNGTISSQPDEFSWNVSITRAKTATAIWKHICLVYMHTCTSSNDTTNSQLDEFSWNVSITRAKTATAIWKHICLVYMHTCTSSNDTTNSQLDEFGWNESIIRATSTTTSWKHIFGLCTYMHTSTASSGQQSATR